MQLVLSITLFTLVFLFGTAIGSFLNVLIYRIPQKLDFVHGRSFCPNCEHQLAASDLVPVLSYLLLGRRCRYCSQPISPRYMLVELAGGVLALGCWCAYLGPTAGAAQLLSEQAPPVLLVADTWLLGSSAPALAALVNFAILCVLLVISLIDADTMEIPDGLNITLALLGLLSIIAGPQLDLLSRGIGILAISLPLFVIAFILPGAFGGGDIKLMAAAGLILGWQQLLVAFFIGLLIGGSYGVFVLLSKRKGPKEHFAFGPALCIGIAVALFAGRSLLQWYLEFFFL